LWLPSDPGYQTEVPRSHEKPSNLTHLLPPTLVVEEKKPGKKFYVLDFAAKFLGYDITNRRHVYAPLKEKLRGFMRDLDSCLSAFGILKKIVRHNVL